MKLGLGRTRNFVDLLLFKAKDDSTSTQPIPQRVGNLSPDENLVIGLSMRLSFGRHWTWQTDGGASLYTQDIRKSLLGNDERSELRAWKNRLDWLLPLRESTSLRLAAETALRYQSRAFQLALSYRQVEPEYQTMGAWFFQTDIRQINVALHFKPAQSQRIIGGASLSINPSERFGLDIQANNFQFSQENRYLDSDSLRLRQATRFFNISPHWLLRAGDRMRSWAANLNYQQSDDYNPYTRQKLRSEFVFTQVQWGMQQLKRGWNTQIGLNARFNKSGLAADDQSIGLNLNAGKSLLHETVQVQGGLNVNLQLLGGNFNGRNLGAGGGISWKAFPRNRIYLNIYYLSNKTRARDYSFFNTAGGFEYTF
jgi:hypothetical protein